MVEAAEVASIDNCLNYRFKMDFAQNVTVRGRKRNFLSVSAANDAISIANEPAISPRPVAIDYGRRSDCLILGPFSSVMRLAGARGPMTRLSLAQARW